MLKKIKTVFWFIKNPQYISQIFQILKRKSNSTLENSGVEATNWCKENCIDQEKALQQLVHISRSTNLADLYSNEIKQAQMIAENCPAKMGGEGAITFIYHLVKNSNAKKIIETGVGAVYVRDFNKWSKFFKPLKNRNDSPNIPKKNDTTGQK